MDWVCEQYMDFDCSLRVQWQLPGQFLFEIIGLAMTLMLALPIQ